MKRLTKKQIKELHSELVERYGGKFGVRDEGMLESAIYTPYEIFFGEEVYRGLLAKAARLAYGLIADHPFFDGNKRIGLHAALVFLALNGVELNYDDDELIALIVRTASGLNDDKAILKWLEKRVVNRTSADDRS